MSFNPEELILEYRRSAEDHSLHHSQYQFDYVYQHMCPAASNADVNNKAAVRESALWLSTLLAHWGMFRPSSSLRDKNILFFENLYQFLMCGPSAALAPLNVVPFECLPIVGTTEINMALSRLRGFLEEAKVSPTDTLVSKIILALTANVPAYDKNFRHGLRVLRRAGQYSGVQSFSGRGLHALAEWSNEYNWPRIRCCADRRRYLPRARLVDMAIFQHGKNHL